MRTSHLLRLVLPLLTLGPVYGLGAAAKAASRTVCINWEVLTTDSGFGESGWSGANEEWLTPAYGTYISVLKPGWSGHSGYTSSSNGCLTFDHASTGPFTVQVWAYSKDGSNNVARLHDGNARDFDASPGATEYWWENNVYVTNVSTHVNVGDYSPRATLAAALSRSNTSARAPAIVSNTTINAGEWCEPSNSAHYSGDAISPGLNSWSQVDDGLAFIAIRDGSAGNCPESRNEKFIVAHEFGHAKAMLASGYREPSVDTSHTDASPCNADEYGMFSREFNSVGAREGFAHFYSVLMFNSPTISSAWMHWKGDTIDVEFHDPHEWGGWLKDRCGTYWGTSTNVDWLRTFWDFHTPTSSSKPDYASIQTLYSLVLYRHYSNTHTLSGSTYFGAFMTAAPILGDTDWTDEWDYYSCFNGINVQSNYYNDDCAD